MTFWTKAMIASQGAEAKFTCRADGYPRPTIRWQGLQNEELTSEDFTKYEVRFKCHFFIDDALNILCISKELKITSYFAMALGSRHLLDLQKQRLKINSSKRIRIRLKNLNNFALM